MYEAVRREMDGRSDEVCDMMKMWLVIYVAGKIAGSAGPYPLEEPGPTQCESLRQEMINKCVSRPGAQFKCPDYELKCEPLDHRPPVDPDMSQ